MFIRLQIRDPMARFVAHDEYLQAGFARDSLFLVEAKRRGSRLKSSWNEMTTQNSV